MSRNPHIQIDYDHPVKLAETMAQHIDRSEATISTWCVGHARLFSRFRTGNGCSAHTFRDTLIWFSDNWPIDLEWPMDITRPSTSSEDAA